MFAARQAPHRFLGMFKNISAAPGAGTIFNASKLNRFAVKVTLGQMKTLTKTVDGQTKTTTYIANDFGAGIVLNATKDGSNNITNGYYVELRSSAKQANEVAIVEIRSGVLLRGEQKVFNHPIAPGEATDLSVTIDRSRPSNVYIRVTINGHFVGERGIPRGHTHQFQITT